MAKTVSIIIFFVFSDKGYWGKGKSLTEAIKNARYSLDDKILISVFNLADEKDYDDAGVDGMCRVRIKGGTEIYQSKEPECIANAFRKDDMYDVVADELSEHEEHFNLAGKLEEAKSKISLARKKEDDYYKKI